VVRERYVNGTANHGYQVWLTLEDGSYVAG